MKKKYMVCWENYLFSDVSTYRNAFYYQTDIPEGEYYFVRSKCRMDAVKRFMEYNYDIFKKVSTFEELREEIYDIFLNKIAKKVSDTMFEGFSNREKVYKLAMELNQKISTLIEKTNNGSGKKKRVDYEKVKEMFEVEKLFELLSSEDIKKLWFGYHIHHVAIVELMEI